jgi:hypothetical protein
MVSGAPGIRASKLPQLTRRMVDLHEQDLFSDLRLPQGEGVETSAEQDDLCNAPLKGGSEPFLRKPMAKSEVRTHTTKCGKAAALQAIAKLFGVFYANQTQCERILVNLGAVENVKVGSPHCGRGDCGPTCFARSHPNFPLPV